jgi:UDP-N-acetyl-D-mannosaminuronate dehydrogenase
MQQTKNVVAGLGEIGFPILKLLSKHHVSVGYDTNTKLMDHRKYNKLEFVETMFLHVCIPYSERFIQNVMCLCKKFDPSIIVIHSTISPHTTKTLQNKLSIPVIYSATRGVHKRMLYDLKRYTKFFAIEKNAPKAKWAAIKYAQLMEKCGVKTRQMSNPVTLELAKIVVDTSYYGWLINYAQLSNMIAIEHNVNYDEMWLFSDEIQKILHNRPKMYPGYIGGHCVIPNLDLIHNQTLNLIKEMNELYSKKVKNVKTMSKKYSS